MNDHFHNWTDGDLHRAKLRARRDALEEAARLVERYAAGGVKDEFDYAAQDIRALGRSGEPDK